MGFGGASGAGGFARDAFEASGEETVETFTGSVFSVFGSVTGLLFP